MELMTIKDKAKKERSPYVWMPWQCVWRSSVVL